MRDGNEGKLWMWLACTMAVVALCVLVMGSVG